MKFCSRGINRNDIISRHIEICDCFDCWNLKGVAACCSLRYAKGYDPDNWLLIDPETAEIKLQKYPDRESPFLVNGTYYAKILSMTHGKLCLWIVGAEFREGFGLLSF